MSTYSSNPLIWLCTKLLRKLSISPKRLLQTHFWNFQSCRDRQISLKLESPVPWGGLQKRGSLWSLSGWAVGLHDGSLSPSLTVAAHARPEEHKQAHYCWTSLSVTVLITADETKTNITLVMEKCVVGLCFAVARVVQLLTLLLGTGLILTGLITGGNSEAFC